MADIANNQKNTVGIENITSGNDLVVNSDGSVDVNILGTVPISIAAASSNLDNGKVFYIATDSYNLATAASNNPIFLLKNPTGSGKTIYLFSIVGNCVVSNVQVGFSLYKSPTITANGTAVTPVNAYLGHSNTSVLNIYKSSTISASGTLITVDQVGQNSNSSNMVISERIAIPAGQSALITGNPFSNNRAIIMSVGWIEI